MLSTRTCEKSAGTAPFICQVGNGLQCLIHGRVGEPVDVVILVGSAGSYFCKVTISKGSKKDFRAVFCDVTSGSCSEAR
jgi:hypothetical protein